MTVWKWSTTAASNSSSDSTINWAEGQTPASVNDSARALMAAIAKWRNDISGGTIVSTGSANTYSVSTGQGLTSLTDGFQVAFKLNTTNTGTSTLNVDALGAKPLRTLSGSNLNAGEITSGCVYTAVYEVTGDEWLIHGGRSAAYDTELSAISGLTSAADRLPYYTGSGTAALATFTSFGRSLVDDADAATARSTLGLGAAATTSIGTSGAVLPLLDGNNTYSGNATFSVSSGVTARNTSKAFGYATISGTTLTHRNGFNGTWTRSGVGIYVFTFGSAFSDTYYTATPAVDHPSGRFCYVVSKSTSAVTVETRNNSGSLAEAEGVGISCFYNG